MKRILLYILLLLGAGCKVTQPLTDNAGQQPEASARTASEEVSYAATDSVNNVKRDIHVSPADTSAIQDAGLTTDIASTDETLLTDSITVFSGDDGMYADSGSLPTDSLTTDTIPLRKGALEAAVEYKARDSIIWTAENIAYLFGEGDVKYQQIGLNAEIIQVKMDSSLLHAVHGVDTLGEKFGYPVFTEGDQTLDATEMYYNFKTRKAYAIDVLTRQGEGYVTATVSKKMADNVINMQNGFYTTCDADHPHFHITMTKAKARTGKDIVTGPAYLVIEDVPLYLLGLPFAFFPFTDTYSSGVIMPTYGDEMSRGFFLRNGGYYFALSDYYDLALTGEWYTKGSWGLNGRTSYRKRYKYSGNFDLSYMVTKLGDKGLDDYSEAKDFKVRWSHTQDAKANPYRTVSASIDYSTSSFDRKNLNTLYTNSATNNNKSSSVSISKRFPNKPFNISSTMNIRQRSQDSSVSVSLPDLNFSLSRIYPLKRKNPVGKERWYEKVSMNYSGQLKNSISTKEDQLFKSSLIKDWQNAMVHRTSVGATYNALSYINLSPSVSYTERWYTNRMDYSYNSDKKAVAQDTTYGFYRVYDYNASVSASTTMYGMFVPWKPFRKIATRIRHRMDPSVSFSLTPDFGDPRYGYYRDYINGMNGMADTLNYSPFSGQLFGVPGKGKSGSISFTLDNNIEAKVPDATDPSGEKKVSIIDKLSGSMSYNLMADSMNWSNLRTNLRVKLGGYTLNLNAEFDTYMYEYDETRKTLYRINKTRWEAGKGIGRLRSTGTSYAYTFSNDTFKKWFGGGGGKKKKGSSEVGMAGENGADPNTPDSQYGAEENVTAEAERSGSLRKKKEKSDGEYDYDGYYNAVIPWSFSINYNLAVGYGSINEKKKEYNHKLTHALSFNGNIQPTKNWRIDFNATYDFDNKKISYMTCSISRSMHCWQMSANIIPIGPLKSYSFTISASASMLSDLKYDQSSSPYNNRMDSWY